MHVEEHLGLLRESEEAVLKEQGEIRMCLVHIYKRMNQKFKNNGILGAGVVELGGEPILGVRNTLILCLILARALREIKHYQKSPELILPLGSFQRICREILNDITVGTSLVSHFSKEASGALQCITETVMVELFEMTYYRWLFHVYILEICPLCIVKELQ